MTFDFSSEAGLQAMGITAPAQSSGVNLTDVGTITMDGVSLTAVNGSTETRVWNSQGNYALRIYVGGSITFAVESGSITDVTITPPTPAILICLPMWAIIVSMELLALGMVALRV